MVQVRIAEHPAFEAAGRSTWISGQDNEQFAVFWREAREGGLLNHLRKVSDNSPGAVTQSHVFGISRVENDPENRAFHFFIAAEVAQGADTGGLERYTVPACKWAIFSNEGALPASLIESEMYAFMQWLPASPYRHANAPELEVYPDNGIVEFWLPVVLNNNRDSETGGFSNVN